MLRRGVGRGVGVLDGRGIGAPAEEFMTNGVAAMVDWARGENGRETVKPWLGEAVRGVEMCAGVWMAPK